MSHTTHPPRSAPLPIRLAHAALAQLRAQDEELAARLEKILPAYALHQAKAGVAVSVDSLLTAARTPGFDKKQRPTVAPADFMTRYEQIVHAIAQAEEIEKRKKEDPLLIAARTGNTQEVARLVGQLTDIHYMHDNALIAAALHGRTDTVAFLLARGVIPHHLKDYLLNKVAAYGHTDVMALLLEHGISISDNALVAAAMQGRTDTVAFLLARGADVHALDDHALRRAAKRGHIDVVALLLEHGANVHAERDIALFGAIEDGYTAIAELLLKHGANLDAISTPLFPRAAAGGHIDTLALLLDYLGISIWKESGLIAAAEHGHTNAVALLLERGADIHAQHDAALISAVANGHIDTVELLLEHGANIHAQNDSALCTAAHNGDTSMVRLLLKHGADIHACNDEPLRAALLSSRSFCAAVILLDHGANPDVVVVNRSRVAHARMRMERWQRCVRVDPSYELIDCDPSPFKPALHDSLMRALERERYTHALRTKMAYNAMALFQSEERVLQYLKAWGAKGIQPLHDIIYMIDLPHDLTGVDLKAWGDATLKHGPKMARLVKFCDRIPAPLLSDDGKTWSYTKTRAEVARHAFARAAEHPALAALCFEQSVHERDFEAALDLAKKPRGRTNMPEITITGAAFDMQGAVFRKLANDDIRGLFLGEMTDCCQSIGGAGEKCARHGFTSENGGFYVVETAKGEIIGQSWAWRGKEGELCLDSLETLGERVSDAQWTEILQAAAAELTQRKDHDVSALHVGMGGKTPSSLAQTFKNAAATPVDYKGYRDSSAQIRVWKR